MGDSIAGLILVLLGGLALIAFVVLVVGPGEVVGLGGTFVEAGNMTVCYWAVNGQNAPSYLL